MPETTTARDWIDGPAVPPAQVQVDARVTLEWDDEAGGYYLAQIHLPAGVPEIEGPGSTIWLYRPGACVQGLRQPPSPA